MQTYEITYVISDTTAEEDSSNISSEVTKQIEEFGGVIIKEEPWGKRRLAYPINHRSFGYYVTVQTHLEVGKVKDLDRLMRLNGQILRHIIVNALPQAVKTSDEEELTQALNKRVEEKITQKSQPTTVDEPKEEKPAASKKAVTEEVVTEKPAEPAKKRARTKKTEESEKKEANDEERKKLVEEKLSQILGEEGK